MGVRKPPSHLSREAKKIWREIDGNWVLDVGDYPILKTALEAYDRLQAAREVVKEHGLIIKDPSRRLRANPALKIEKEARSGFLRAWKQLGIDEEPPGPMGRPPGR